MHETISVSTVRGLTSSVYEVSGSTPHGAIITVETAPVRFWSNGGADPDATEGHLLQIGESVVLESYIAIKRFRAIGIGGTAVLQVEYINTEGETE